uniref:Uncharacterized protein n=1 Tax=Erysipelothrix tonsillarum TaxID=38402 RepID=A0A6S6I6B2_9FIRM|nr:hypothetical protein [Erysipelothrix tonsillarum]
MIVIVSLLFFVVLLFTKTDEDGYKDSLVPVISSKSLNGFFTCLILISHFIGYVELHDIEFQVGKLITNYIGQLMVASFLFFSGYGIYSGIKKNDSYITNKFPGMSTL